MSTHKKRRSKTRKAISSLAKASLVLMGESVPTSSQKTISAQKQLRQKNRPYFLKILIFFIKVPLLIFLAATKYQKNNKPNLQDTAMGEPMAMSKDYYLPDDKY